MTGKPTSLRERLGLRESEIPLRIALTMIAVAAVVSFLLSGVRGSITITAIGAFYLWGPPLDLRGFNRREDES